MKFYITLLILPFFLFSCDDDKKSKTNTDNRTENVSNKKTTYLLIRHAEKDRSDPTNRDPELNEIGLERAANWASYFENYDLQMVYATDYKRTQQTATPTAVSKRLEVLSYDPSSLYDEAFIAETEGKEVLIVGHSNTTPAFVNAILGEQKFENMDDSVNDILYKVIITKDGKVATTEKMYF